jgi:PTS system ascorbate-specific IIA component
MGAVKLILDLLKTDNIKIKVEANNWKEVVEKAGKLLKDADYVEEKYIKAMKDAIIDNGPYVVIGKGIALLHARPEDGVKKMGMSLVTLKEPVEFGNKNNDPVKIAFAFCAEDNKKHINAIADLSQVLMEENSVNKISEMKSSEEIIDYIKKSVEKNQ